YFPESNPKEPIELKAGEKINQYTIIKKIGTGGMGIVYLAKQNYPAERQVALKLIQQTPKQQQLIAETQILAKLNHPNIATLYEIDKTKVEIEQLYIAMEFIEGEDIISWCKSHHYSIRQILKLFQQLCAGIGFAHEKGIIHCDIKPNNVLVTSIDEKATVKIIDFGISQLATQVSIKDDISGTPAYLAPEILENKETLINDTRRDVYALGVLLKKLLPEQLPQDLQAIINKASANQRENRYPSPVGISNDIDRYFNKQAISARKPTIGYLTGLFIRRRFIVVLVSLGFVLTLIGGYINQSRLAQAAQAAQIEAEELSAFMTDLFNVANPEKSKTDAITALDLLDKAQTKLLEIKNPTLSDARFMHTIGSIYTRLGKLDKAKIIVEKSLQLKQNKLNPTDREIVQGLLQLGLLNKNLDEYDTAEKNLQLAVDLLNKQKNTDISQLAYAHNHLGNLYFKLLQLDKAEIQHQAAIKYRLRLEGKKLLADSYNNLGVIYREKYDLVKTTKYMHLALNIYEQEYGNQHAFVGIVKTNLAIIEESQHHFKKSEQLMIGALDIFSKNYGKTHGNTITVVMNLVRFYDRRMRQQKAIDLYEEFSGSFDTNTPYDIKLSLMAWIELIYAKNHQYGKANKIQQEIFNLIAQKLPAQKYLHERIYTRYIQSLIIQEQFDLANQQVSVVLELAKNKWGIDHFLYLNILYLQAEIYFKTQDIETSKALYQQILDAPSEQRLVIIYKVKALIGLAKIFRKQQQLTKAHSVLNKALTLILSVNKFSKTTAAIIHYQKGMIYVAQDKPALATAEFEKALAIQILELPSQHPGLIATQKQLSLLVGETPLWVPAM
ncbi:MAG: protein kinase, partial [Proteobacteria bacterium]|nr:protein kinase [Pseudomonadota bacterium]